MIVSERTFCIYCRGEILTENEIRNKYHNQCYNKFQVETLDMERFDKEKILNFKTQVYHKMFHQVVLAIFFLILLGFSFITFSVVSSFYNATYGFFSFLICIIIISYFIQRIYKIHFLRSFCDIILKLHPQYQHLSFNYCLATIGETYLISRPSLFISEFIFILRFLNSSFDESTKFHLPSPKFVTTFRNEKFGIRLARWHANCQIPYNRTTSKHGEAIIYCIEYSQIIKRSRAIFNFIFLINRENDRNLNPLNQVSPLKMLLKLLEILSILAIHLILIYLVTII